ncbi:hypothetical protein P171DRAFT_424963 [Karstenula rhodostoma CBS 690.94]|uniref:DUF1989 domain-containing protein n=1 Tax=Karstenula rhodostoma CBS 690.94 TaxID=1392251 RepID=A0A9P4P7I7_9PLEO|nr:hypothetical protein P171DRAFT_424963 [Karstenula rhodostoma CBS 690.94]
MSRRRRWRRSKKLYNPVAKYWADYTTKAPQPVPAGGSIAVPVHKGESIKIINTHGNQVVAIWALAHRNDPTADLFGTARNEAAPIFPNDTVQSASSFPKLANVAAGASREYMSTSHTRSALGRRFPRVSDILVDQKRAPILRLVEDTSPGVHDTLSPACDRWLYARLGIKSHHASCFDNYWDALSRLQTGRNEAETRENNAQKDWVNDKELEVSVNDFCSDSNVFPDPIHLFGNVSMENGPQISGVYSKIKPPVSKAREYVRLEAMRDVVVVLSACPQVDLMINEPDKKPIEVHYEVLPRNNGEQDAE